MAIYFKDKEITNIDSLIPQTGLDITDIWFGNTNVYTVWQIYEGTLPATLNANGDDMRQYQIYGATGGVGDRTVNLFDESKAEMIRFRPASAQVRYGINFGILSAGAYTISFNRIGSQSLLILTFLYSDNYSDVDLTYNSPYTFTAPEDAEIIIRTQSDRPTTFSNMGFTNIMLVEGTTPPENYVPYGYGVDISTEKPIIYGFHINPNDPNSNTAVTYLEDAIGKIPAAMGSTAFSYGDWVNAFFMPRPCMLKYDGTVDYYLNPNDYSQKADGTASDYNNLAYGGNAMMEFPLIWYKFVQGAESGEGYFYCSNRKVDDSYKCFSNLDCDGNIIEHFYMPIYNGCTYDGKMRSISGLQLSPWSTTAYSSSSTYAVGSKVNYQGKMWKCTTAVEAAEAFDPAKWEQFAFNGSTTGVEEIAQAMANNVTAKVEWYTDVLCDRMLINGLLVLISKSLDTQGAFGRGIETGSQAAKEAYVTGSLDDKGLFYGSSGSSTAVKVFGMENWWACVWHRTAGLVGAANNIYKYKMTYSTADGSTANGYNTDGTGYLSVGNKPTTNNYIKKMQYGLWGCLPIETGSYSTQFFRDYWYNGIGYALFGGNAYSGANDGAFCANLGSGVGPRYWNVSSDLSCKPCRVGNLSKNLEDAIVTPIYIGDTALQKDEYVDYKEQKVYRRTAQLIDAYRRGATSSTIGNTRVTSIHYILATGSKISAKLYDTTQNLRFAFVGFNEAGAAEWDATQTGSVSNRTYDSGYQTAPFECTDTASYMYAIIVSYTDDRVINPEDVYGKIGIVYGSIEDIPPTYTPYLQPTDPPVALPALPTYDGETIADYVGQSVAIPEKVAFKYRKKNF